MKIEFSLVNAEWFRVLSIHGHLSVVLTLTSMQQILGYIKCVYFTQYLIDVITQGFFKPVQKIHFMGTDYGNVSLILSSGCCSFGWGKDLQLHTSLSMVSVHLIASILPEVRFMQFFLVQGFLLLLKAQMLPNSSPPKCAQNIIMTGTNIIWNTFCLCL